VEGVTSESVIPICLDQDDFESLTSSVTLLTVPDSYFVGVPTAGVNPLFGHMVGQSLTGSAAAPIKCDKTQGMYFLILNMGGDPVMIPSITAS
jgi:hypothetical protein